ncbi:hypothetical protein SD70_25865 [Gordoniibacillus kamchatkensis]|uniref:Uncharacterized protein n=1 Tax=Gordoniibacillus kamchatkensis TaxID=1590651 RepID=A0ABR5ACZ1_9BACL|nr:hypothetical protein [Paenibacillus sp. VKM B-2647]KIL38553.1 hypothetical protein SD70_25865 [Paenibacillus sp. VKM B-2647]
MIEIYAHEFAAASRALVAKMMSGDVKADSAYFRAVVPVLELLREAYPDQAQYAAWEAEFYHLDGSLRRAGELYKRTLQLAPPRAPTETEMRRMRRFCPLLLTTPLECFPLKDVAAVHHPSLPLIGYHLFWEDDFDFPDDYEPCDHEEIWVEYDPVAEAVTKVMTFFHSSVIESPEAAEEARAGGQRPVVRIEWGKHGSLLKGWENLVIPLKNISAAEWLKETYEHVRAGGRVPDHPLKRHWPQRFEGTFEQYTDFSVRVDPIALLDRKPLFFTSLWVNAVLFTEALLYNFHPKMEWPERFYKLAP